MKPSLLSPFALFLLALPAAAQQPGPAAGQEAGQEVSQAVSPETNQTVGAAVEMFATRCLAEGPRFNQTVTLARQQEWPALAADMAMAFTPVGDPVAIEGWLLGNVAKGDSFPALVVYRAQIAGKMVEGCTLAFSGTDAAAFDRELALKAKARPLGEEAGEDTLYKRYSAGMAGREGAITETLPRYPKGNDQVIVSVVAEEVVDN